MVELRIDGYYLSEGRKWEDWHAGHKEEGYSYEFIKININNTFFSYIITDRNFNFIDFLKKYQTIKELQNKTSVNYGNIKITNNKVQFSYIALEEFPMHFELEIISPELLKDKDGRKYHFVPVDEEKLKGLPEF